MQEIIFDWGITATVLRIVERHFLLWTFPISVQFFSTVVHFGLDLLRKGSKAGDGRPISSTGSSDWSLWRTPVRTVPETFRRYQTQVFLLNDCYILCKFYAWAVVLALLHRWNFDLCQLLYRDVWIYVYSMFHVCWFITVEIKNKRLFKWEYIYFCSI